MNRRDVLLGAIALVGGSVSLASCGREAIEEIDLYSGERRFFDAERMRLLGRIVDVVIPETDTPGALAAGVDVFIDGMMADWAAPDTQRRYLEVLEAIDQQSIARFGKRLADLDPDGQQRLLRDVDADTFGPTPALPGFRDLKALILAGYYTSEIGATVELQYELVPGDYLPCAPLADVGRAWAHD